MSLDKRSQTYRLTSEHELNLLSVLHATDHVFNHAVAEHDTERLQRKSIRGLGRALQMEASIRDCECRHLDE